MANTVKLKRSAVQGNAPSTTDLALGELGLNTYDGKLFMKKDDGTEAIVEIGAGGTDGERDFIASGEIANGNRVILNADGTVSTITGPAGTQEIGTAAQFATNAVGLGSAYDSVNQKVVVVYPNGASSQRPTAVVGTVSGTSISFGTPVQLDTNTCWDVRAVYDVASGKVVVIYRDSDDSFKGKAFVGTVSGTSISFGSKVTYSASGLNYHSIVYDETNEKVVIVFDGGTNTSGRAVVGTVSGTSISFGSEVSLTGENKDANFIVAAYDSTNGKIVVAYEDDGNFGDYGKAVVGTVSGTSISFGTPVTFESASTNNIAIAFDSFQDKIVISYRDKGNSDYGTAIIGTVSDTSISFGTPVVFENTHEISLTSMCFDSDENKVIIAYRAYSGSAEQGGYVIAGEVSGTSISFGSSLQFESTSVGTYSTSLSYDSANRRSVLSYRDGTPGVSVVYKSATSGKELTSTNYIGLATESIAHQATGKITVTGGINESQSGLTVAESYYVQSDGTLSTTAGTPAVFAGTALSSTKILANIPEANSSSELVSDTAPQLGGDLDMNSNSISSGVLGVKNEGTQSEIRLYCESDNAHYAAIKAPLHSNFSGDITFTIPATDGSANQVLKTDGSGNLGWVSQSGGGGGGGAASSVSNDTGHLYIVNATGNDDSNIYIQAVSGENSIICYDDSGVVLYNDNTWRLQTTSSGFTVNGTGLGNFKANDNNYLIVGTDNDFQIYHDETNTYLDNDTGHVYIRNNVDDNDSGNIYIQAQSGEHSIVCNDNSSVTLYNDGTWRFQTSSSGFTVNGTGLGNFKAGDNQYLIAGTGNDFQVYHDETNTYLDNDTGHVYIRNNVAADVGGNIYIQAKSDENSIVCNDDGSVTLYHDNIYRLQTTSTGVTIPGTLTVGVLNFPDGDQLTFGNSNDLQIYHDGGDGTETNDTFIDNNTGDLWIRNNVNDDDGSNIYIQAKSGEHSIVCNDDSSVTLYNDSTWRFQTSSSGFTVNGTGLGNFKANDNNYLIAGTGNDFQVYHDGTNTYLDNDTGHVYIRNNVASDVGGDISIQAKAGENSIYCSDDGGVTLYYDNVYKLQTTTDGVNIPGTLTVGVLNFPDGNQLTFGADNDFRIYHDGGTGTETNWTYLDNYTGRLYIRNNVDNDDGGDIAIQAKSGENSIYCGDDGSVSLYYDSVYKFQTSSTGFTVNGTGLGNFKAGDNQCLTAGTDNDFRICHDETHTYLDNDTGHVYIRNNVASDVGGDIIIQAKSGENSIYCGDDGGVSLYYDSAYKLQTTSSGFTVNGTGLGNFKAGDNQCLTAGTGDDFRICHDETHTYLDNDTGHVYIRNNVAADVGGDIVIQAKSGENSIYCADDGVVSLYYDNSLKLQTISSGVAVNGNLDMSADNYKILLGTDNDFEVYHDGTNTYLDNDTGDLYIRNNVAADVNGDIHIQAKANEESIVCNDDGNVQLYSNNILKLNTSTSGVTVAGTVSATGLDLSGMLSEGANITLGKLSANVNINLEEGMVHLFAATETAASTPNIRFNSTTSLNSSMAIGDAVTVALISATAAAGYSAQLQIDGTNVTEKWLGGSAPSTGGAGGYDVYTYNIIKTADADYLVLANLVNFA